MIYLSLFLVLLSFVLTFLDFVSDLRFHAASVIMNIGERIKRIRTLRGMTQKDLGIALGFPERSADVRVAQYESGSRTPKEDVVQEMAKVLKVKPKAIADPDYNTYIGLMYMFFDLEETYGIHVDEIDGDSVSASIVPARTMLNSSICC